jgi:hypothetical protein
MTNDGPPAVTDVIVTPASVDIEVGDTARLQAEVRGDRNPSQAVRWSSDDVEVATADDEGVVTGVAEGEATVAATSVEDPTVSDSAEVVIREHIDPDEFLVLEPGGIVTGVDDVRVGAPEGVLERELGIRIEKVNDPTTETPFPDYLDRTEVVGGFYEVSVSRDVWLEHENYLLIGLPVPEELSTENLAIAVLSPPGSIIVDGRFDPSMLWEPVQGQYDESSGLFGTIEPFVGREPVVYAIVKGETFDVSSDLTLPSTRNEEESFFIVECWGIWPHPCTDSDKRQTRKTLDEAYAVWVKGEEPRFKQPRLRHAFGHLSLSSSPTRTLFGRYVYRLEPSGDHEGAYNVFRGIARTIYPGESTPSEYTTRHEFFHSLQVAYENTVKNYWERETATEILQGTATAAEASLRELTRSSDPANPPFNVDIPLFSNTLGDSTRPDEPDDLDYSYLDYMTQDFFVYLGRRLDPEDPQINYLVPLFEKGGTLEDINQVLQEYDKEAIKSLGESYWSWVKNQSFEKRVILGTDHEGYHVPHSIDQNGKPIPSIEPCEWSGHAERPYIETEEFPFPVDFTPEDGIRFPKGGVNSDGSFDLDPLASTVFKITPWPQEKAYWVTVTVDSVSTDTDNVEFKFYEIESENSAECWNRIRDNDPHTFHVESLDHPDGGDVTAYVLVSNTNWEKDATARLRLTFEIVNIEIGPIDDQRVNAPFNVTVTLVDEEGNPKPALEDSTIILTVAEGNGTLNGNLSGTLSKGNSRMVFENVTYDTAEKGVRLQAVGGSGVLKGVKRSSDPFDVLATTETLLGVWGSAADDVYAVGVNGVILHHDGTHWRRMNSPTTARLETVWGSAADDVFAVGTDLASVTGTLLHYDGSGWRELTGPTANVILSSVWGTTGTDVFVVGTDFPATSGTVLHYDGDEWNRTTINVGRTFGVWGSAADDVFAVGEVYGIDHYDGTGWKRVSGHDASGHFFDIWGTSGTDVFTVGQHGRIRHYDGTNWRDLVEVGTRTAVLLGVWGSTADDVYAVGYEPAPSLPEGIILHYDGTSWHEMERPSVALGAVWGTSSDNIFAVGSNGTILRYDGKNWE